MVLEREQEESHKKHLEISGWEDFCCIGLVTNGTGKVIINYCKTGKQAEVDIMMYNNTEVDVFEILYKKEKNAKETLLWVASLQEKNIL